uniref:Uncharacterized protein n=1 Tax=Biomphalaria glabrata TaxID=6526 RepID=A0A2C9LA13_BIOGL
MDDILAKKRLNYIRSASDLSIVRTTTELKPTPMHQPRAHKPLEATQSLQGQSLVATVGFLGLSPDWRRNQLKKMGDTIDNSHPSAKTVFEKDRSLSLPPLLEESALSHLHSGSRQLSMSMRAQRMTQNDVIWSTQSSSSSTDNSDDLYMGSGHQSVSRSASDKDSETIASTAPQEETSQAEVPDDDGRVSDLEKELIVGNHVTSKLYEDVHVCAFLVSLQLLVCVLHYVGDMSHKPQATLCHNLIRWSRVPVRHVFAHPYETVNHILFECPFLIRLRQTLLPLQPNINNTLYGSAEQLKKTTHYFVLGTACKRAHSSAAIKLTRRRREEDPISETDSQNAS